MAFVNISNVVVENNPAPFLTQLKFQITFECLRELPDTVEWKLIYIGSAKDQSYDQLLDSFEMGPLQPGVMQFTVESNPPDYKKIPKEDLLGNGYPLSRRDSYHYFCGIQEAGVL
jgi:histone chaperone ASF1